MKIKQKTIKGRYFAATLLLMLLLSLLTGCFGGTTPTLTMASTISPAEDGNMSADELQTAGNLLAAVYDPTNFDSHDMIIAALRGYDMTAAGFDDSLADPNTPGADDPVTAAKNVLTRANERAADAAKVPADTWADMNEADLQRLVDIFKITVDTATMGGAIDAIQRWIGGCLNWITRYLGFGSYIVGICIFAVIIELLMLPFAIRQQKNSIRQARLRPKEMAIRNKYKGRTDQPTMQKMQKEIQDLYQRENYSPFSGCLPLLLQFPIIIVLYNIVVDPLHYVLGQTSGVSSALASYCTAARAAGGLGEVLQSQNGTIELLSGGMRFDGISNFQYFTNGGAVLDSLNQITSVPDFNIFGQNFGLTPSFSRIDWLLLVPVLTFVVYFFSMRLNRKFMVQPVQDGVSDRQVACSNTMMDVSMPAMSTFFTFLVPGIVGIYWMFRSIVGVLKTFVISKIMPLPKFTEEDYKAAAREMAGKAPKKPVKSERAGLVRSLHHIDDEDFDDTREQALARKAAMEEQEEREQAAKAKKSPFGAPALKKDRKPGEPGRNAEDAKPAAEAPAKENPPEASGEDGQAEGSKQTEGNKPTDAAEGDRNNSEV